ncbi:MAG: hypothetical protein HDT47_00420 [Ruminococcaceae bacterium]|nr:hypothetical protein [Oscillospiraceae bacterium]
MKGIFRSVRSGERLRALRTLAAVLISLSIAAFALPSAEGGFVSAAEISGDVSDSDTNPADESEEDGDSNEGGEDVGEDGSDDNDGGEDNGETGSGDNDGDETTDENGSDDSDGDENTDETGSDDSDGDENTDENGSDDSDGDENTDENDADDNDGAENTDETGSDDNDGDENTDESDSDDNDGNNTVYIDTVTFPDDIFRAYVSENFDADGDGCLSEEELEAVLFIDISGGYGADGGVASVEGIEYFYRLSDLYCAYNELLTEINIGENTALAILDCSNTGITKLDVSNNLELTCLICSDTRISRLDLSANSALTVLYCNNTRLAYLDLSGNPELTAFDASGCVYGIPLDAVQFNMYRIDGIDMSKVSEVENTDFDPLSGRLTNISGDVKFKYECSDRFTVSFTLSPTGEDMESEIDLYDAQLILMDNGSAVITEEGFVQGSEEFVPWTGKYLIKQSDPTVPVNSTITVESGAHYIIFDNVNLYSDSEVFKVGEQATAIIDGLGVNTLTGETGCGIYNGGVLSIEGGEFSVFDFTEKNGINNSAAVKNLGKLIVNKGAVLYASAEHIAEEETVVTGDALVGGITNYGVTEIYGGVIIVYGESGIVNYGQITVEDGNLTAKGDHFGIISIIEDSFIEISGGDVVMAGGSYGIDVYKGILNLSGGNIKTSGNRVGICVHEEAEMTISGGAIHTACDYGIENYGKILISGGIITVGGDVYDIYSGENGSFTVSGGSMKLEHLTLNTYALVLSPDGIQLDCEIYDTFPEEGITFELPDGGMYTYGLSIEDCDEDGLYYVWRPTHRIAINIVNFPDEIFRNYVQTSFDLDGDEYLSEREVREALNIFLSGSGVSSLDGIEFLTNLSILECGYNPTLTFIDVSENKVLTKLICSGTGISFIDLSENTAIVEFEAEDCGFEIDTEVMEIGEINLGDIEGLDITRVSNVVNADYDDLMGVLTNIGGDITYEYRCSDEYSIVITVKIPTEETEETSSEDIAAEPPEETVTETSEQPEEPADETEEPVEDTTEEPAVTTEESGDITTEEPAVTEPEEPSEEPTYIGIENGSLRFTEDGYYQGDSDSLIPLTGACVITQTSETEDINAKITVESGTHDIIFDGVRLTAEDGVLTINEGAEVKLYGIRANSLTAGSGRGIYNSGILDIVNGVFNVTNSTMSDGANGSSAVENYGTIIIGERAVIIARENSRTQSGVFPGGIYNAGAMEINGVLSAEGDCGIINSGSLKITGDVTAVGSEYGLLSMFKDAFVEIGGGRSEFNGKKYGINIFESKLTVTDGEVKAAGENVGVSVQDDSQLNVKGGKLEASGDYGIENYGRIVINGGEVNADGISCDLYSGETASVTVTDGTLKLVNNTASSGTMINGVYIDAAGGKLPDEEDVVPVFDAEAENDDAISMTWPTSASVIINPYGMKLNTSENGYAEEIGDKIISNEMTIINNGKDDVVVSVIGSVSATRLSDPYMPNDDVVFASEPISESESENKILLWIESTYSSGFYNSNGFEDSAEQLLLGTHNSTKQLLYLDKEGGTGYLKIKGDTAINPERSWSDVISDVDIRIALSFKAEKVETEEEDKDSNEEKDKEKDESDGENEGGDEDENEDENENNSEDKNEDADENSDKDTDTDENEDMTGDMNPEHASAVYVDNKTGESIYIYGQLEEINE